MCMLIVCHCIVYNGCVLCILVVSYGRFVQYMKGYMCYMLVYICLVFHILLYFDVKCIVLVVVWCLWF